MRQLLNIVVNTQMFLWAICENSVKDQRGAAGLEYSHIGIPLLPVGVVMCDRPGSRVFGSN